MNKRIFLFALFALLFLGCAYADETMPKGVSRSFSSPTVQPSADLTVTLRVILPGNETYYVINELIPSGWIVKDAGTGSTEHSGHIKWVVIENAVPIIYTYTLTAPSEAGTATFSGTYMMEGMESEAQIWNQKHITVEQAGAGNGETAQYAGKWNTAAYVLLAAAAIAAAAIVAMMLKKKKK